MKRKSKKLPSSQPSSQASSQLDLSPYAGRWVALVGGRVAGIGLTPEEARLAAKLARPKEEPIIRFVPARRREQTRGDRKR